MTRETMSSAPAFSGLPGPFLEAMRQLFDIMDKEGVGAVHINGMKKLFHCRNIMLLANTAFDI